MAISVATLIADTRRDSGLRNNRLFSDDQIASILTDAYADLRDKMIVRFAYWFRSSYDFTLTSGEPNNVLDLSLVPDLEMVQALFLIDSEGNPHPIDPMSSISEVNQVNSYAYAGVGLGFNGFAGRKYFLDGNSLFIYPAANANGNYRLVYTPQAQRLALPITRTFAANAFDTPLNSVGPGSLPGWSCANGAFSTAEGDVGATLTPSVAAPNTAWNVPFTVTGVISGTIVNVTPNPTLIGSYTLPSVGTFTFRYQPLGSIAALPDALTPWAKYLTLFASRVIRTSRRQAMGELDLQFQQIEKRIVAITKQRTLGVIQPPVRRTNYGGGGFGGGFGGL